jgi:hypothetical protein
MQGQGYAKNLNRLPKLTFLSEEGGHRPAHDPTESVENDSRLTSKEIDGPLAKSHSSRINSLILDRQDAVSLTGDGHEAAYGVDFLTSIFSHVPSSFSWESSRA